MIHNVELQYLECKYLIRGSFDRQMTGIQDNRWNSIRMGGKLKEGFKMNEFQWRSMNPDMPNFVELAILIC